jgi:hypothetical protein
MTTKAHKSNAPARWRNGLETVLVCIIGKPPKSESYVFTRRGGRVCSAAWVDRLSTKRTPIS